MLIFNGYKWFFSWKKSETKRKVYIVFRLRFRRFKFISPDCPDNHHINLWTLLSFYYCYVNRHCHRRHRRRRHCYRWCLDVHNINNNHTPIYTFYIYCAWIERMFHKKMRDVKIMIDRKTWYIKWALWMASTGWGHGARFFCNRASLRTVQYTP